MRMMRLGAALAFGAATTSVACGTSAADADPAEQRIEEVWSGLDAAWNARDVETFAGLFAEDASFLIVARDLLEGRAAIRARYAGQFSSQSPELRHVSDVERVQLLADGLAAVDVAVRVLRMHGVEGGEPEVLRSFAVFAVMTEHPDGWEIRAVRIYALPDDP